MPEKLRAAIIGCGAKTERRPGGGMAYSHARGYQVSPDVELVALADIKPENAEALAKDFAPDAHIYTDYKKMLKAENLDMVSICLWIALHEPAVLACCKAGVKIIHCEKPMAPTYGAALKMVAAAEKSGSQLTFNHQRRFLPAFRKAKEIAHSGALGNVVRIEGACSNMIDWGTHWIDMMFFFNNETPAKWVLGQIDARQWHEVFGLPFEHQAICEVMFQNGVRGLLYTGEDNDIGCQMRIMGTDGVVELRHGEQALWVRGKGDRDWKTPKVTGGLHGGDAISAAIQDAIDAFKQKREPELSARRALQATEVIFSTYESSRRRGRVDMPLKQKDSAFLTMLEEGILTPKKP